MKFLWLLLGAVVCTIILVLLAPSSDPLRAVHQETQLQVTTYKGKWFFPRGGPYILGFNCFDCDANLRIDGKSVALGSGQVLKRHVFPKGTYDFSLNVSSGKNVRILWHPPGRRGPPEYLTSSFVGKDQVSSPGCEKGAFFPWGLLVVWAVFLCLLVPWRKVPKEVLVAGALILATALAFRFWGLQEAGQTWDEDVYWSAGKNYLVNILEGDVSRWAWGWNYEHPPLTKYVAGVGALTHDGYEIARWLFAIAGAFGCVFVFLWGRRLYGLPVGISSGLFAAMVPHLVGHSRIVGHEALTMLCWPAVCWLSLRVWDGKRPWGRAVLCGVVIGLTLSIRFSNGLVAPIAALGCFLTAASWKQATKGVLLMGVTSAATLFVLWPRLWTGPIASFQQAWNILGNPHGHELFFGQVTNTPSFGYFFAYWIACVPVVLLVLACVGTFHLGRHRERKHLFLFAALLVPFIVSFSPVKQDGVRYVLPAVQATCVLAALGLAAISSSRWGKGVIAIALSWMLFANVRVQPYQIDYFNEFVGGAQGVEKRRLFELGWWGEGLDRAINYVNANAQRGASVYKQCVAPSHLAWLREDLWATESRDVNNADWWIVYSPSLRLLEKNCVPPKGATLVYQVEANGGALAQVYRR